MIEDVKAIGKLVEEHAKLSFNPDKFERELLQLRRNQRRLARLEKWLKKYCGGEQQEFAF